MPWITKDSANTPIEDRDEPWLTDAMRERLEREIVPRYETRHAALLPTLHTIQHEYGWVPPKAMFEAASFLGIPAAEVIDTASFYEEYWLQPKGKHIVAVCRSIACEFCGQPQITDAVRQHLGIDVGETTPDNDFTLVELECIGSCGTAPAILIDETLHETVSPSEIPGKLEAARKSGGH
ncbi:MAG: NADH-quinone oxidoreductase subunit NuoE [Planctomycetota bacterium]